MGGIAIIKHHRLRIGLTGLFLIYIFTVLWITVLNRSIGYHEMEYELFWSYKKWFAGDAVLGRVIMANIAVFIPFGFLMSVLLPFRCSRKVSQTVFVVA